MKFGPPPKNFLDRERAMNDAILNRNEAKEVKQTRLFSDEVCEYYDRELADKAWDRVKNRYKQWSDR